MEVECNNEILLIKNPIYLSSKILNNVMNEASIGIMTIPSQFYELLKIDYSILKQTRKFEMLQFYDFLEVDEKYTIEICNEIGEYLERSKITIPDLCKDLLFKHYPILNFYPQYGNLTASDDDLAKYSTPYYYENVKKLYYRLAYCAFGNLKMVKYLCSPDYLDVFLSVASKHGHLEIIKWLVIQGSNIKGDDDDDDAIILASGNGHLETVKWLFDHGANINSYNNKAIKLASENGHLETVKWLFDHGGDINASNNKAIRLASRNGHLEVVKWICSIRAELCVNL